MAMAVVAMAAVAMATGAKVAAEKKAAEIETAMAVMPGWCTPENIRHTARRSNNSVACCSSQRHR